MMNGWAIVREGSLKAGAECFLVLFALLVCAPSLFGQESYREFERGLNLSGSQKAQVAEIKKKYMAEWMALKDERARKRLELREFTASRPDERVRSEELQRDLDQLRSSRLSLFRRYEAEVSSVFNEEQRSRFKEFMDRESRGHMNRFRNRAHER